MSLITSIIPKFVWKILIVILILRALPSIKHYEIVAKQFKDTAMRAATLGSSAGGMAATDAIASDLRKQYGKSIPRNLFWLPFSAGGLSLRAQILYPSLMEYAAVFSAPATTVGRSGFHWANSSCTVLTGEVSRYSDHTAAITKESFRSGQVFRHGEFESYIYEVTAGSFVTCYGRGVIPISAAWPLAGSISNGDVIPAAKLAFVYVEAYYRWAIDGILGLWNTNAPKQWRVEL